MSRRTRDVSREGKLVDTWIYKYKGIDVHPGFPPSERDEEEDGEAHSTKRQMVRDQVVEVQVRIGKSTDESDEPPHPTSKVEFQVSCDNPIIRMSGTDIEALRKAVWGELDEAFEVDWQPYFKVQISRPSIFGGGIGEGLEFEYNTVYKGTAHDGTLLCREFKWRDYRITPWEEFKDEKGQIVSCIPDNEFNRKALEEYCARLKTLREMLAETIRPKNIDMTLRSLGQLSLLPPTKQKGKKQR